MVSLQTLQEIEQQCRSIRNNNISWGGLKVILLCGDFYQFPPVKGRALWQEPSDSTELTNKPSRTTNMAFFFPRYPLR